jgi:hypothetical protein
MKENNLIFFLLVFYAGSGPQSNQTLEREMFLIVGIFWLINTEEMKGMN